MNRQLKVLVLAAFVAAAALAAVLVTRSGASSDTAKLSNAGGGTIAIRGLRMPLARITKGKVLAIRGGRAFYRLTRENGDPCFGVGAASEVGAPGSVVCPRGGFPRAGNPVLDLSVYEGTRHDVRELSLFRVQGFAADGVAAIEFLRPNGDVALRVPVIANVYFASSVPAGPIAGVAAVDADGNRIWRSP